MKNFRSTGFLSRTLLVIFLIFLNWTVIAQTFHPDFQDGKVYFKFKDNISLNIPVNENRSVDLADAPFLDGILAMFDVTALSRPYDLGNDPKLFRTFMLEISDFEKIEILIEELQKNPDFEYVEKVSLPHISYIPNDELYNFSFGSNNWNWHLDVINAVQAWDFTQGSADVKVAIVDNAVWTAHEDLADKIVLSHDVTAAGNQNSDPPAGGDPEGWSHGTHCAGLAGAATNNEIGVASIGFNTSLIGVKATPDGGNPNNIYSGYSGIQWAANNGADVISLSWGNTTFSTTEQNVITAAHNLGCVIVAAAGNDNWQTVQYPANYNYVIAVASTDEDDVKSWFSNYGTWVDISAPGGSGIPGPDGLMSTTFEETGYGYYNTYFGTSMACPFTAGLCGLILGVNPLLSPEEVEDILKSTATDIDGVPGNETYAGKLGAGRIDAFAAVTNTPFDPTADFMTEVPYITPGTIIQFFDLSQGVPNEWSWEFQGGAPNLSNLENPSVQYNTEGNFTVSLGVTNDYGEDVLTRTGYITVTSTPVPWVLFSADTNETCVGDVVSFTDASLYDPTSWLWTFDPATVTFTNGTSETSQNPEVIFDEPGIYTVTLAAANANGEGVKTIEDMVSAQGINLNFSDDFETGGTANFTLTGTQRGKVSIDVRAAAPGSAYGLHFQGGGTTGGWSGGPTNTTPDQAWNVNVNFHGFAENCNVDATGIAGVKLTFDLRQTYTIGNKYSWFRVLINDSIQVADEDGVMDFNPATNTDPFDTKTFDLSSFGNSQFSITLQSSCYLADGFNDLEGDNVFVDNIMISNFTGVREGKESRASVLTYPNPVKETLNFSANSLGSELKVRLLRIHGQSVLEASFRGYRDGQQKTLSLPGLPKGIYFLEIRGDKNSVTKKVVVE